MNQNNESTKINDELEPQLESAVWAVLSQPVPPQAVELVKARATALANQSSAYDLQPTHVAQKVVRRRTLGERMGELAIFSTAAVLFLGLFFWFLNESATSAYAQAIEQLKSAGAFRYTETIHLTGDKAPIDVRVLVADDGRQRREQNDVVTIQDKTGTPRLTLVQSSKKAIVNVRSLDTPPVAAQAANVSEPPSPLQWLEQLKSHGEHPDQKLGEQTIGDHRCVGFSVKIGQSTYKIWTDMSTNDLVQVEFEGLPEGSSVSKSVLSHFEFKQSFDGSLFSDKVPEGYTQMEIPKAPKLLPPEESLVDALKGYTELSKGKFPETIADWGQWAVFLAESGTTIENSTRISSRLGAIMPFLTSMPKEDYEYLGAGKSTHDAKTIVFWYRNADKKLRAVYNDLTVADIAEKDLAKKQ